MAELSQEQLCINHVLSVVVGYKGEETHRDILKSIETPIWNTFVKLLRKPSPAENNTVEATAFNNIEGHATSLCSFVKDCTRYVWYYNPWGYRMDIEEHDRSVQKIITEKEDRVMSIANHTWFKPVGEIWSDQPDELTSSGLDGVTCLLLHSHRLDRYLSKFPREEYLDVKAHMTEWELDTNGNYEVDESHAISVLYMMKCMANADHLVVMHPTASMPPVGPQVMHEDGITPAYRTTLCTTRDFGACATWMTLYNNMVKFVIGDLLSKGEGVDVVLFAVLTRLNDEYISEETRTRVTLAQYVNATGGLGALKKVLAVLYKYIPPGSENDAFLGSKRLREKSPFTSRWHHTVYEGLSSVPGRVEMEVRMKNDLSFDPYDEGHCECTLPGFIEVFSLVMAREGILGVKESELIRRMVIELKSDNFVSFSKLEDFINLLTFMIACKHEEAQKPGAGARVMSTTQPSDFPPLTRRAESLTDSYFKVHARVFKYSILEDGSRRKDVLSRGNKRTRLVSN